MSKTKKKSVLLETKNTLSQKTREEIIGFLNDRLADSISLGLQCKQAHWNVRGENFIALHKLFDEIHKDVQSYTDGLAERVGQLGGVASGTCESASQSTQLSAYSLTLTEEKGHLEALSDALAQFSRLIREGVETCNEAGDPATADLLTEITRGTDKWLWMVESHRL